MRLLGQIKLNADKAVQVLPRMSGIVESVTANVGDSVKKGQTLAVVSSLDVAENRGDLSAAQQRLNLAKTTLAREESLWREDVYKRQSLSFLTLPAFASKEDIQSRASVQIYKLQQQIKAAEANKQQTETVKAVECKKLVEQGKKC